jgi:putative heme transporter
MSDRDEGTDDETVVDGRDARSAAAPDATFEMEREGFATGELPTIPQLITSMKPRVRPLRFTLKTLIIVVVMYFLLPGLVAGFNRAAEQIRDVNPVLIALGFALEVVALYCYSLLTRAALGSVGDTLSGMRLFRIQLSTKALSHIVPGGNAAGSVLGYRLLTLSGVSGPQAGFALATAGIGSAVVLNVIFWMALLVSIPIRGVNPLYGTAALIGVIVIGIAAALVFGIIEGQSRAVRVIRWIARKLRTDEDRFEGAFRQIGERLEELVSDRVLLRRVMLWAAANWLFDAAALWVFVRAFGGTLDGDALLVAFGLANVLAAIPILPGGLGVVEGTYLAVLPGFGIPRRIAAPSVAAYRSAQYLFPILLGGLAYASLRVGPWKIEKRDRLARLRELARDSSESGESKIDFALRFRRDPITSDDASPDDVTFHDPNLEYADEDGVNEDESGDGPTAARRS